VGLETHESHDVVDVFVVDLDGHVVEPGLDPVVPPLGVDRRLEDKSVRIEQPLEPSGPGVAVLKERKGEGRIWSISSKGVGRDRNEEDESDSRCRGCTCSGSRDRRW
jgi:hypothetical protein